MARHKQIKTEEQGEPEMEISSMIDCCFLLLIYFLVATSLVSEKKLDISIPSGPNQASSEKPPVDPGRISVKGDGTVMWNEDLPVAEALNPDVEPGTPEYRAQRHLETLVEHLKELKMLAETAQAEPIVMLQGAAATPHQRIVDVMAALAEAGIQTVGINTGEVE